MPNFSFLACLEVAYSTFPGGWRLADILAGWPGSWMDGWTETEIIELTQSS